MNDMKNDRYRFARLFAAVFAPLTLLAAVGCSDDREAQKTPHNDAESHLSLLGYARGVKEVVVTDREGGVWLEAAFLSDGRCRYWNDTGVARHAARGFIMESAWYEYEYDAQRRLSAVVKHPLSGEAKRYTITYGSHRVLLPSPLPVARLENYMLQGVAGITAEGYTLTCDGRVAESEAALGREDWGMAREVTTSFLGKTHTLESESRVVSSVGGETTTLATSHSFFTYAPDGRLLREETVTSDSGVSFRLVTDYMKGCGVLPVMRSRYPVGSDEVESQVVFDYAPSRQPLAVRYLCGEYQLAEQPFTLRCLDFDAQGNWTRAVRESDGETLELYQTLTYHRE